MENSGDELEKKLGEVLGEEPSDKLPELCYECGQALDEDGDCPDALCPNSPYYQEVEEDEDDCDDADDT